MVGASTSVGHSRVSALIMRIVLLALALAGIVHGNDSEARHSVKGLWGNMSFYLHVSETESRPLTPGMRARDENLTARFCRALLCANIVVLEFYHSQTLLVNVPFKHTRNPPTLEVELAALMGKQGVLHATERSPTSASAPPVAHGLTGVGMARVGLKLDVRSESLRTEATQDALVVRPYMCRYIFQYMNTCMCVCVLEYVHRLSVHNVDMYT